MDEKVFYAMFVSTSTTVEEENIFDFWRDLALWFNKKTISFFDQFPNFSSLVSIQVCFAYGTFVFNILKIFNILGPLIYICEAFRINFCSINGVYITFKYLCF